MKYLSTRGAGPEISFREAVLAGLAPDGGLYMPVRYPALTQAEISAFREQSFPEIAAFVLTRYSDEELNYSQLLAMASRAYDSFETQDTIPVIPLPGGDFLLELFHGPTLAFKDVAMQMLAELYEWALEGTGRNKTIIGATSGDTGGAAIKAFAGKKNVEVFMLHPKGRISDVQRRMMTTVTDANIVNIAIEGTFDDCQSLVKSLFSDRAFAGRFDLGGVNSINWVRLAAQCSYYFSSAARFDGPVNFVVPTGNFGDVFAGYAAKRMGLDAGKLCVAVNSNDIMRRVLKTGRYEPSIAAATTSPSMDIQTASNFERLLFDASGRDAAAISKLMADFASNGGIDIPAAWRQRIDDDFAAESASEAEVSDMVARMANETGMLVDPHTAVGLVALEKLKADGELEGTSIALATAHPAKFPDAVEESAGRRPELPQRYADLMSRAEAMETAPAHAGAVKALIEKRSLFAAKGIH